MCDLDGLFYGCFFSTSRVRLEAGSISWAGCDQTSLLTQHATTDFNRFQPISINLVGKQIGKLCVQPLQAISINND